MRGGTDRLAPGCEAVPTGPPPDVGRCRPGRGWVRGGGHPQGFDEARASVYRTLIYDALAESPRRKVDQMDLERVGPFQEPPFVQKIKAMGEAEGLKAALLKIIARAGLTLGEEERARIEECYDLAVLDRWVDNAIGAKTAADLFQ